MNRRTMLTQTAAVAASVAMPALDGAVASSQRIDTLFDQFMKENLDLSPLTVTSLGLDTGDRAHQKGEIDDSSEAGIERGKALVASQLKRLQAFDRASLQGADRIDYDVVLWGLRSTDRANKQFDYGSGGAGSPYVLSQLTGSYSQLPSFLDTQHIVKTDADAEAYLARLEGFAATMDQELAVAAHDRVLGVVPPDFAIARALDQMKSMRAVPPDRSPLTVSLARRAQEAGLTPDYTQPAASLVRDRVYPALERQVQRLQQLQPHAAHDPGVWRLPQGPEYYRESLASWCTTEKSPQDIHRLGLDLVKEHTAQIDARMRKQSITGGTVGERLRSMFADVRYRYPDTDIAKEQLIAMLNGRVRQVQARLPEWFGAQPKATVEIRRVPKDIEAGQAGGYYNQASLDGSRPGIYWINLRDTAEQPTWTLPSLTYHESIPGHHLQLSVQQEAKLPLIRKVSFYSAYIEGWALYAEQLAVEMGMYADDPLGEIGQLQASMLRCVRLVVDTGMHALKWSREQAMKFYIDTLGELESSAATEIERYSVWPGQACAYMLGKLEFLAQREKTRRAQGTSFDIRTFHDRMLLSGAVPLPMLDELHTLGMRL